MQKMPYGLSSHLIYVSAHGRKRRRHHAGGALFFPIYSSTMKPILLCGSIAYDRIMDFDGNFSEHFMADKLHSINVSFFVSPPTEQFGGTGGNIAYGLSLLSTPAEVMATAGTDFDRYDTWLKEHSVNTSTIHRADVATASGYIMTDKADNQITAFSGGAAMNAYGTPPELSAYAAAIISPTNRDDMVALPIAAKAAGLPYFFDPGQQIPMLSGEEIRASIEGAAGVLLNDYELSLIMEKTGWSETDIASKAGFLVVTLGAEGSRIITNDGEERVNAVLSDKVIDPTGAGDAYRSGFLAAYVRNLPLSTCAKAGSAVAAYAVECYGTQNHHFTLEELRSRFASTYKESFPF